MYIKNCNGKKYLVRLLDEGELDVEMAELVASQTFMCHSALLSKGLALNCPPTVNQALDGLLPYW